MLHFAAQGGEGFGVSGIGGEVVDLVRIVFEVEEHFGGAGAVEGLLFGVEFSGFGEVAPFGEGGLEVAVFVVESVEVEGLVASPIGEFPFAEESDLVVFFIEAVGVSEGGVARVQFIKRNAFAEEG